LFLLPHTGATNGGPPYNRYYPDLKPATEAPRLRPSFSIVSEAGGG
jgi:hypothetical protein